MTTEYARNFSTGRDDRASGRECMISATIPDGQGGIRRSVNLRPRKEGSKYCESGSVASGGDKLYCTCDICF
jgi:hypothetical protein